jgi:hypothetical protein
MREKPFDWPTRICIGDAGAELAAVAALRPEGATLARTARPRTQALSS